MKCKTNTFLLLYAHGIRAYTTPWVFRTLSSSRKKVMQETVDIFKTKNKSGRLEYFNKNGFKISYKGINFVEFQSPSYIKTSYDIYDECVISFVLFLSENRGKVETASRVEYVYFAKKTCGLKWKCFKCFSTQKKTNVDPAAVMRLWLRKFDSN